MSRIRLIAAGAALSVIALFALPTAASAHDQLLSSTPAADAALETAPTQIELTFSAEIMDAGAEIRVVDASLTDHTAGELTVDANVVTVPVAADLPVGGYQVRWRVVSSDGHPISGLIPFTIGDAAPMPLPSAGEETAEIPAATETPAAETPAAEESATTQSEPAVSESATVASESSDDSTLRMVVIGGIGAIVALAVALIIVAMRRSSRARAAAATPENTDKEETR